MSQNASNFIKHLKNLLNEKHLLSHPFYQHWENGTLPLETLQKYTEQYYHLEKHFPRLLSAIHTQCADPAMRQSITENLYEEEHGHANHRELWLRFAEAIGAHRDTVQASTPLTETAQTLRTFDQLCASSVLEGAAALAAYEGQMPDVAKKKIEGLAKHYNVSDPRGTAFFRVHGVLDVEHAHTWWSMIETEATTPDLQKRAEAALVQGRDALWNFLNGICRAYLPANLDSAC